MKPKKSSFIKVRMATLNQIFGPSSEVLVSRVQLEKIGIGEDQIDAINRVLRHEEQTKPDQ